MSIPLRIKDETTSGEVISENVLSFPAEKITAQELIEGRVGLEVETYNSSSENRFFGLVQPSDSEKELNGFRLKKKRKIDVSAQKKTAINAFSNNGFFLLVNDKQVEDLNETIIITPNTNVVFLKLIPLVGG